MILQRCSEIHNAAVQWLFTIIQRTYCSSSLIIYYCSENILQQFSDSSALLRDIYTAAVQWFFTIVQRYILQQFSDSIPFFRYTYCNSSVILYHCSEIHAVGVQWFYPLFRDKYCSCSVILYHCSETHTTAVQWFNTIVQIYIPQQFSDSSLLLIDTNYRSSVIFAIVQR